jgi:hypothetical protein
MQEQITDKTVVLAMRGTKMTARLLAKGLKKLLAEMKKHHNKKQSKVFQGKQSVKQLVKQNAGVTNIEISDSNIKSFEAVARKYGVDFALKKDKTVEPPKWLVFFKARDADALTAAFSEYTAKTLNKSTDRPSVLNLLRNLKELVKNQVVDRTKQKTHGGPEL